MRVISTQKRITIVALILISGMSMAGILMMTKSEPEKIDRVEEGQLVETIITAPKTINMSVTAFGTAEAKRQVTLTAEVSGRIMMCSNKLREGMYFETTDCLLEIDPRTYSLAVKRAEAQRDTAEANIARLEQENINNDANLKLAKEETEIAQREVDRQTNLRKTNVSSESTLEIAKRSLLQAKTAQQRIENTLASLKTQITAAKAELAQADAALEQAKLNMEKTLVDAPFNGRSMKRFVDEGQFVSIGTQLATVYDTSAVEVTVNLPYDELLWLNLENATRYLRDSSTNFGDVPSTGTPNARAFLETAGRTYAWDGYVSRVAGIIDQATRTVPVIVEFPNPWDDFNKDTGAPPLVPGMFVRVEIEGKQIENVYELPRSALRGDDQVYLSNDGKIKIQPVDVLRTIDNLVYISGGLKKGDAVIVSPLATVVNGMKIRIPDSAKNDRINEL